MLTSRTLVACLSVALFAAGAVASDGVTTDADSIDSVVMGSRQWPIWTAFRDAPTLRAVYRSGQDGGGSVAGSCPQEVRTHSDANFSGGSFIVQAGFAEQEMAGASYVLPAALFPVRLDLAEMIFATSAATVSTTTKWSILVYEGTPATGTLVFSVASDDKMIPHIVLGPGTNGVNVQFMVDPADPEQIYINDNGSHTFSIAYRIDDHNNQTANPCFTAPPSQSNAFPTTDTGGLQQSAQNWIWMVSCPLGCGAGWKSFAQLPSLCRPSGDWVIRATVTPVNCAAQQGACCINGNCAIATQADCATAGGVYRGDATTCTASTCLPQGNVACCFESTGGCVNLGYASCLGAGGVPGAEGSACATTVCFPTGACCLPNGQCVGGISPSACAAQGGNFQGNGTTCATVNCPLPQGASCFPNGFCLILSEAEAIAAGAVWKGAGTTCADGNGNGTADQCEAQNPPGDINGDGLVNGLDMTQVLANWGAAGGGSPADINDDGIVDGLDMTIVLSNWTN